MVVPPSLKSVVFVTVVIGIFGLAQGAERTSDQNKVRERGTGLSLWIDQNQVKLFSGFPMEIFVIADGHVLPYILDPNFEKYLPVIPAEVASVNFTWKSGGNKYLYKFSKLKSFNQEILDDPVISIGKEGKVPKRPKVFSVLLPCSGNVTGVASFGIGLMIKNRKRKRIAGMPLKLKLQKNCAKHSPDPECDKKCANGGKCNQDKLCECAEGYMGQYCSTALCYPQCMNGGTCISPGVCSCAQGYQGTHCEGGICTEKCMNGGKCIQKDTCSCPKGYFGPRCQFSKCRPPCQNGGRCVSNTTCHCREGFHGKSCELGKGLLKKVQHRRMNVTNVETGNECGYDKLLSMNSFLSTVYLTGALVIMSILLLLKATISCQILDAVFFLLYRI